ncbi:hypothetical protein ELI44_37190 [Rhizobium ruizarguesonis]|uniref:hypothetical protein n=1 Tax=Rhizobium ruizarguesonis TaxID=2081791 RepID=UPI0010310361|nr:hypothetical protein [Rhizobium ruizarguesonis]TAU35383.1 hypothetical protein ELI42_37235 [Rhizobium ruizarguesonis]TAU45863.1 hypothetical protein ELI44_37190 [Rhizobium ruizarguesonis]
MAFTAQCTIFYNRGVELVPRLARINQDKPAEKMGAIARSSRAANLEAKVDGAAPGETFYQLLDEVRELDNKVKAYVVDYEYFSGDFFALQSYAMRATEAQVRVSSTPATARMSSAISLHLVRRP